MVQLDDAAAGAADEEPAAVPREGEVVQVRPVVRRELRGAPEGLPVSNGVAPGIRGRIDVDRVVLVPVGPVVEDQEIPGGCARATETLRDDYHREGIVIGGPCEPGDDRLDRE